ncbi:dehydrogenase/reductase SDR family member on chromosome X-like isoform X2 [Daktulosphaira vitifoliae]|uniref:dehydrogenase/reductase SDR family member on chromosome X-like isoform X2 n=1 Tax=Daktulosphaira vitifoliae TaxID=58002 RepID=UPI0021AA9F09|nr:dehydrogenase/reductase SDR family member on chromosome X-like isoform X2 [Daktulosphaira vitifoliae]
MIFLLLHLFNWLKYQMVYYILGAFAIIDDLQNRENNKFEIEKKRGKVAVITGGARGIGLEVVKKLLSCEMHVIIGCRNVKVGESVLQQLALSNMSFEVYSLDLKSFSSVKNFAQRVLSKYSCIDVLVNNAGVMFVPYEICENGFEAHWTVNYLSHFLLIKLLQPVLKQKVKNGNNARIVNVTSCAYKVSPPIDFNKLNDKDSYLSYAAYAKSKLAQLIMTKYLSKILEDSHIRVIAVHPGIVDTEIFNGTFLKLAFPWILKHLCKTKHSQLNIYILYDENKFKCKESDSVI